VRVLVLPDLHGRPDALAALLRAAGVTDDRGARAPGDDLVVQLGDLINGTMADWDNDERILRDAEGLIDFWCLGNHDAAYDYPHLAFNGFAPTPAVRSGINRWLGSGKLVPAIVIGDTLISHAGVHEQFAFETAKDAADAIEDVWARYHEYAHVRMTGAPHYSDDAFRFRAHGNEVSLPKALLLDGLPKSRGGWSPLGGILWADWAEPKNTRFSQVVGHTSMADGPVLTQYLQTERFTLNIDAGAKKGLSPYGVWLDSDGGIIDFVEIEEAEDVSNGQEAEA